MNGLINWLSGFEKKPGYVFVNHGDDDSCSGFAKIITEKFGIPASAPYAGSEFDLEKGEWIRITDPVYRENKKGDRRDRTSSEKKDSVYADLRKAVESLDQYTRSIEGYSNYELKKLTEKILALISDQ